jgi:hypothetical protein
MEEEDAAKALFARLLLKGTSWPVLKRILQSLRRLTSNKTVPDKVRTGSIVERIEGASVHVHRRPKWAAISSRPGFLSSLQAIALNLKEVES